MLLLDDAIQRGRRSGLEHQRFVQEPLPGKSLRRRGRVLEHHRPRLATARLVRTPRRTKYQALLERSTGLGEDRLSAARSHDPPYHARGRWSRRLDTPHKWRVRG